MLLSILSAIVLELVKSDNEKREAVYVFSHRFLEIPSLEFPYHTNRRERRSMSYIQKLADKNLDTEIWG